MLFQNIVLLAGVVLAPKSLFLQLLFAHGDLPEEGFRAVVDDLEGQVEANGFEEPLPGDFVHPVEF